VDFEQLRCVSGGFSAFGHHLSDLCLLLRRKFWTPTTNPAFLAGSIQSRFGSFLEHGFSNSAYCEAPQYAEFERDILRQRVNAGQGRPSPWPHRRQTQSAG
jgi:hypothetical protein